MNFKERLSRRMVMDDIHELTCLTQGREQDDNKQVLYELTMCEDDRVAYNALWVFTHFDLYNNEWLYGKHDELIDRAMRETHEGKRRLLLALLLRQPFPKESVRTEFIDFCTGRMTMPKEPYGIRVTCMKLAYEQCRHFPELLEELKDVLVAMNEYEDLPKSVNTARRNILKEINNNNNNLNKNKEKRL